MIFADKGAILTLDQLRELKANGVDGFNPYLDPFNAKGCNGQFLRDIYDAGLLLGGFFYETTGGLGQGDRYFTREEGNFDAAKANAILAGFRDAGLVPPRVRVWYADDVKLAHVDSFDDYATGIEETADPLLQTPGIYGFEDLLRWAQRPDGARGINYPNMGPRAFLTYGNPRDLNLDGWQNLQQTIGGVEVDLSEMYLEGWKPMTYISREQYGTPDPATGLSLEDWVKATDRVLLTAEFLPLIETDIRGKLAAWVHENPGSDLTPQDVVDIVATSMVSVGGRLAPIPPFPNGILVGTSLYSHGETAYAWFDPALNKIRWWVEDKEVPAP